MVVIKSNIKKKLLLKDFIYAPEWLKLIETRLILSNIFQSAYDFELPVRILDLAKTLYGQRWPAACDFDFFKITRKIPEE